MAHTRQHMRQQARERRRKTLLQIDKTNKNREIALKQKKLLKLDKRGKVTKGGGLKKQLANIPAAEHDAKVNRKARGLSNLVKDYKKQEAEAFKKAEEYKKSKGTSTNTTNNKSSKTNVKKSKIKKTGKSALEAKNRARFGDAHVDKLKAKQVDFKKMRKGGMSKADFIKKYPKSITAQRAKGLRK